MRNHRKQTYDLNRSRFQLAGFNQVKTAIGECGQFSAAVIVSEQQRAERQVLPGFSLINVELTSHLLRQTPAGFNVVRCRCQQSFFTW